MLKFGIVANTHGIRGHLKILSNSDFKNQRLKKGSKLYLEDKFSTNKIAVTVSSWKKNNGSDIIKLENFDNINDVLKFKNYNIFVDELSNDLLKSDEYLFKDLIGCNILNSENNDIMGIVSEVSNFGGDDLLQIKVGNNGEIKYIPFIERFIKIVDIENKSIVVDIIPGLL